MPTGGSASCRLGGVVGDGDGARRWARWRRPGRRGPRDRYGASRKTRLSARSGRKLLLEEQLDAVGQRLQDAERPGPVGADAVLHVGDDLALEPDHEQHRHQQHDEDDDALRMTMRTTARSTPLAKSGSPIRLALQPHVGDRRRWRRSARPAPSPGRLNGQRRRAPGHARDRPTTSRTRLARGEIDPDPAAAGHARGGRGRTG